MLFTLVTVIVSVNVSNTFCCISCVQNRLNRFYIVVPQMYGTN